MTLGQFTQAEALLSPARPAANGFGVNALTNTVQGHDATGEHSSPSE